MQSTRLYQPVNQHYQAGDPKWREAVSEASRRREMDRERERQGEANKSLLSSTRIQTQGSAVVRLLSRPLY